MIDTISKFSACLKNIKLFSTLTDDELHKVIERIQIRPFKKGQTVIQQEDTNKFMYIILEGAVKVTQLTDDGREIVLASRQAGEYFGEVSLLDGKTTSATVTASRDSVVAIISKETFSSLIYSNTKILENLLHTLCFRLRGSIETIQILNHNSACRRVRLFFEQMSKECGQKTDEGIIIRSKLTQQDIADRTGLARQTVTEILNEWKRNEDIAILKSKFILLTSKFIEDSC